MSYSASRQSAPAWIRVRARIAERTGTCHCFDSLRWGSSSISRRFSFPVLFFRCFFSGAFFPVLFFKRCLELIHRVLVCWFEKTSHFLGLFRVAVAKADNCDLVFESEDLPTTSGAVKNVLHPFGNDHFWQSLRDNDLDAVFTVDSPALHSSTRQTTGWQVRSQTGASSIEKWSAPSQRLAQVLSSR